MRLLVSTVVMGFALAGLYFSVMWGLADFHAQQGYDVMETWESELSVSEPDWQRAFDHINQATAENPYHPVYQQRLAKLYRVKAISPESDRQVAAEAFELAAHHLTRSLEIRPDWPSAYADLIYLKGLQGKFDDSMFEVIELLDRIGPWEPESIFYVTHVGLHGLGGMPAETQKTVLGFVARGHVSATQGLFASVTGIVSSFPQHRYAVIDALVPWLAERPWPPGARSQLLTTTDWAWRDLDEQERQRVVARAQKALVGNTALAGWLRRIQSSEFRDRLCEDPGLACAG